MKKNKEIVMDTSQRKAVGFLFLEYGNSGINYTKGNHEFLRRKLHGEAEEDHFQATPECKDAFNKVMNHDWSPLLVRFQKILNAEGKI